MRHLRHLFLVFVTAFILGFSLVFSQQNNANAEVCEALPWLDNMNHLPFCPHEGSGRILPETYPAAVVVISWGLDVEQNLMALRLIEETLRATPGHLPLIVVTDFPLYSSIRFGLRDVPLATAAISHHPSYKNYSPHPIQKFLESACNNSETQTVQFFLKSFKELELISHFASLAKETIPYYQSYSTGQIEEFLKKIFIFPTNKARTQANFKESEYLWPQDRMKSTFDPATGLPLFHGVANRIHPNFSQARHYVPSHILPEITDGIKKACPGLIQAESTIPPSSQLIQFTEKNHVSGGNSLGMPGGLYVSGIDQHYDEVGRFYASQRADHIRLSLSWLAVGHVDEVIGILRDRRKAAPCDFAISVSSPQVALEVLEQSENENRPFFDPNKPMDIKTHRLLKFITEQRNFSINEPYHSEYSQARFICDLVNNYRRNLQQATQNADGSQSSSAIRSCQAATLTNGEVAKAIRADRLFIYNQFIQNTLENAAEMLKTAIAQKTGCQQIEILRLPDLFYGGRLLNQLPDQSFQSTETGEIIPFSSLTEEAKNSLPYSMRYRGISERQGRSFFPNSNNYISLGDSVIFSHPRNSALFDRTKLEFEKVQQIPRDIDTWSTHHLWGNAHCSTATVRVCRPRPSAGNP